LLQIVTHDGFESAEGGTLVGEPAEGGMIICDLS
jgi:hypothetical protein